MHCADVWQHSSNANIKIVHNSIEHLLWNPSDFFSDNVLFCLWIVFTNSIFKVGWDRGNRMARGYWFDTKWVCPWEDMPEVFKCSVREVRGHLISQTKHLNTAGITSNGIDSFRIKLITPVNPISKISTCLTIFWGGSWKTEFVKIINTQERTSENKSDGFEKKCSIELWTILMFELLLCYHTAVQCMEWT